ncbi:uncharacterized protein N7496_001408 [Penicillium cataractarum]|uniref:Uncharacterized protein n=1 Tax=Penicillium cataractarum TaxID=2100454 RepID=A0A9W9VW78_9EURO|nr:uncharacterized protein N7496_001408 [Penicillium cataractarum]KAJ5390340.1 hypothetical protein N7496_001408 [Penicillium cataractarum]
MFVESLPYAAYGLSLWALATLAFLAFIAHAAYENDPAKNNNFTIALKLLLRAVDTGLAMNGC